MGLRSSLFQVPLAFPTNWEVPVERTKSPSHSYVMLVPTTLEFCLGLLFTITLPFCISAGNSGSSVINIVVCYGVNKRKTASFIKALALLAFICKGKLKNLITIK